MTYPRNLRRLSACEVVRIREKRSRQKKRWLSILNMEEER